MKSYKYPVLMIILLLAMLSACSDKLIIKENTRLTENILNNTNYHIGELGTIRLENGKFKHQYGEGATQIHQVSVEKIVFGDLNGDGLDDAAVVLAWQNGGSGAFKYLVAIQNFSGLPQQIDSIPLGDRVQISALSIADGEVALEELSFDSRDLKCCPSHKITQTYTLSAGKWTKSPGKAVHANTLTTSSEILDVDIIGFVWKWERFSDKTNLHNIVVDDPDKYTLILLSNGAYQVKADCNQIEGQYILEGKRIKIAAVGSSILAECPPGSQYIEYLKHLNEAVNFVLHEKKLVLNLMLDEGELVFKNGGSIHDNGHH